MKTNILLPFHEGWPLILGLALCSPLLSERANATTNELPVVMIAFEHDQSETNLPVILHPSSFEPAARAALQSEMEEISADFFNCEFPFVEWIPTSQWPTNRPAQGKVTLKLTGNFELTWKVILNAFAEIDGRTTPLHEGGFVIEGILFDRDEFLPVTPEEALDETRIRGKRALHSLLNSHKDRWKNQIIQNIPLCRTLRLDDQQLILPIKAVQLNAKRDSMLLLEFLSEVPPAHLEQGRIELSPRSVVLAGSDSEIGQQKCKVTFFEFGNLEAQGWHDQIPNVLNENHRKSMALYMRNYLPKVECAPSIIRSP